MSPNIIQEMLAKSVEKLQTQQMVEQLKGVKTETFEPRKKSKSKVNITKQSKITSKYSPDNLTKALVYNHLKEVAPGLAEQFNSEYKFQRLELKLEKVVNAFNK